MAAESWCVSLLPLLAIARLGLTFTTDPITHAILSSKLDDATHTSITEAGIKDAVRQYFLEKSPNSTSPPTGPITAVKSRLLDLITLNGPIDLLDIFRIRYGTACILNLIPYQFAVLEIVVSNARTDRGDTGYREDFHFDAEMFNESNANVIAMRDMAKTALAEGRLSDAREAFGRALHTLQDFYSHSNWVEMGKTEANPGLGSDAGFGLPIAGPDTRTCKPCPTAQGDCKDNIVVVNQLTSGYYRSSLPGDSVQVDAQGNPVLKPANVGKCSHGGPLDKSANEDPIGGINKDTGEPSASPHWYLHHQAANLAELTTTEFTTAFRREVGDEQFEKFLALDQRLFYSRAANSAAAADLLGKRLANEPLKRQMFIVQMQPSLLQLMLEWEMENLVLQSDEGVAELMKTARKKNAAGYWYTFPAFQDIVVNVAGLMCLICLCICAVLAVVLFQVSFEHCWGRRPTSTSTGDAIV